MRFEKSHEIYNNISNYIEKFYKEVNEPLQDTLVTLIDEKDNVYNVIFGYDEDYDALFAQDDFQEEQEYFDLVGFFPLNRIGIVGRETLITEVPDWISTYTYYIKYLK